MRARKEVILQTKAGRSRFCPSGRWHDSEDTNHGREREGQKKREGNAKSLLDPLCLGKARPEPGVHGTLKHVNDRKT